ncbi:MAG: hypothetical protein Q7S91_05825 [Aquabacterium sp.]|nr:hypothetical protein [Aquabacterium sp.]
MNLQRPVLESTPPRLNPAPWDALPHLAAPSLAPTAVPPVSAEMLCRLPLLCQLDAAQALWLTRRVSVRRVARQARVVEQGSSETGLYFLLKGHAQAVRQNAEGRSLVIDQCARAIISGS